jgi:hypothetical protein
MQQWGNKKFADAFLFESHNNLICGDKDTLWTMEWIIVAVQLLTIMGFYFGAKRLWSEGIRRTTVVRSSLVVVIR